MRKINSLTFFGFHLYSWVLTISLSFQKIGGLADEIVLLTSLFFSNSIDSFKIFFAFIKKVLKIIIQSSLLKLFSFKILVVFFKFLAKQLSISSEIPWFSLKFINFKISSVDIFFFFYE